MSPEIGFVILAAGKGTRMYSQSPKVLQTVLGKPLLGYVYDKLIDVPGDKIWTVVGYRSEDIAQKYPACVDGFVYQPEQRGTGHAVQLAWPFVRTRNVQYVCVVNGDTPYVPVKEILSLVRKCDGAKAAMGILTMSLQDPSGYGRVLKDHNGEILRVVEEKDLIDEKIEHGISEVNSGVYVFNVEMCTELISMIGCNNAQNEYYLTQMISLCRDNGCGVVGDSLDDSVYIRGINSPAELVAYEEILRRKIVADYQQAGVIIRYSDSVIIGPDVRIEPGVEITGPTEIYGRTQIAHGTRIASHCWIRDSILRACQVKSFSHIDSAQVMEGSTIGPFARVRPGTIIKENARIGNFVEIKNSTVHPGAKAGHLSYLGDCELGADANIGAGTITCNYDGVSKHRTMIGEKAFIGSNTALVAPVTIGKNVLVGAGSVVTKDVPDGMLCVARARQVNLERPKKNKGSGE